MWYCITTNGRDAGAQGAFRTVLEFMEAEEMPTADEAIRHMTDLGWETNHVESIKEMLGEPWVTYIFAPTVGIAEEWGKRTFYSRAANAKVSLADARVTGRAISSGEAGYGWSLWQVHVIPAHIPDAQYHALATARVVPKLSPFKEDDNGKS